MVEVVLISQSQSRHTQQDGSHHTLTGSSLLWKPQCYAGENLQSLHRAIITCRKPGQVPLETLAAAYHLSCISIVCVQMYSPQTGCYSRPPIPTWIPSPQQRERQQTWPLHVVAGYIRSSYRLCSNPAKIANKGIIIWRKRDQIR